MLTPRNNQRGFSLVELGVALVVLAILVSVGVPSFMAWIQNSQLRTTSESILAGLQLARAEAVRRNTRVQFTLAGATFQDWTIGCATAVGDLNVDGVDDCPAVIQSRTGAEGTANATVAVDNATITFSGLGRADLAMTANITHLTGGDCVAAGGPMRCSRILVSTGGQIRMCDPAITISDPGNPRGC
jgi:type IV fimbrial biogenesis protein FimT